MTQEVCIDVNEYMYDRRDSLIRFLIDKGFSVTYAKGTIVGFKGTQVHIIPDLQMKCQEALRDFNRRYPPGKMFEL